LLNSFKIRFINWRNRLIGSQKFQRWAGNTPLLRFFARRDGEKIYDLMAGFVYSQTLLAMVELNLFTYLKNGGLLVSELSQRTKIPENRIQVLCQSAVAINLLERLGSESYCLSRLGAAVIGVPGLIDMVRHHKLFYEDLVDPVSLLKNEAETHMSKYWPYVLNTSKRQPIGAEVAGIYSNLMRSSQKLVAEETLRLVSFSRTKTLLDIGGGTGAFIEEVTKVAPDVVFCLFDLPQVVAEVKNSVSFQECFNKVSFFGGSFVTDILPKGFDTITLIRVLYDHNDEVVLALLKKVYDALPNNGRIIISEPMSGGRNPTRSGDSYFGFYTMAMTTGRPRSAEMHEDYLSRTGFKNIKKYKGTREFITKVISAEKKF
jgi:demethylspheroidene O-methyltransferase